MRLFLSLIISIIIQVATGRQFHLGRSRGGNLGIPAYVDKEDLPKAQWFTQKLDHFTPSDLRTWKQRYYVNDTFYDYNSPGPVFMMIGGEGPASAEWMVKGAWIGYAQKFKAMCVQIEHRYYGESHPTDDLSLKNLRYLSSEQALADLANFVGSMNDQFRINRRVKWIAFGGSYPGSLAAWVRVRYPHLIYASVSSSGPLLAKTNFMEYFQVVANALTEKTNSEDCLNQVKAASVQIQSLMKASPDLIEKEFKVCKPFAQASKDDIRNFYNSIADDFADVVQYNEDNRIGQKPQYKNLTIDTVCKILTEPGSRPAYKRLAAFNSIILAKNNNTCLDYSYDNMIKELQNLTFNAAEGGRQWMYQTCTEFGFYQTSSGTADIFGDNFPVDFFVKQCQDVFGKKFDQDFIDGVVDATNKEYGALDISASRIVFVHGSVDPWHALGLTTTMDNDAPVIFIKGTAHCANMYPPSDNDSMGLIEARLEIEQYLDVWLDQPPN